YDSGEHKKTEQKDENNLDFRRIDDTWIRLVSSAPQNISLPTRDCGWLGKLLLVKPLAVTVITSMQGVRSHARPSDWCLFKQMRVPLPVRFNLFPGDKVHSSSAFVQTRYESNNKTSSLNLNSDSRTRVGNFNPNPENPPRTHPGWGGSGMPFFGFGAGLGQLKPAPAGSGAGYGSCLEPAPLDPTPAPLKSAYAIAKLRKSGYSKQKFYKEAVDLYKEINTQMAIGDKGLLRKSVTENMYSVVPMSYPFSCCLASRPGAGKCVGADVLFIQYLRLIKIGVDRNDLNKVFVQLTLEFLSKQRLINLQLNMLILLYDLLVQSLFDFCCECYVHTDNCAFLTALHRLVSKFEAYDSSGAVVAGDKSKEVLVRDIWVFEKSLFHQGAYWRLCGRIKV
ncbi:hypothetical protein Sango_0959600, partial [Sesamum angolense]